MRRKIGRTPATGATLGRYKGGGTSHLESFNVSKFSESYFSSGRISSALGGAWPGFGLPTKLLHSKVRVSRNRFSGSKR